MFRRNRVFRGAASVVSVDQYMMHLFPVSGAEVTSMEELMPSQSTNLNDVVDFHKILVDRMRSSGHRVAGILVVPPTSDVLKSFQLKNPICVPIFSSSMRDDNATVSGKQARIQQGETAMGIAIKSKPKMGKFLCRANCSGVFPALVFSGTRFPLFAPSGVSFACDLASVSTVVAGAVVSSPREIESHGCVLTKDKVPQKVGYAKNCLGNAEVALELAGSYGDAIGCPLGEGQFVLLSGIHPRIPVRKGVFETLAGPLGSVKCTVI